MSNHIRQIIVEALREHGLIAANYPGPVNALADALTKRAYIVTDAIAQRGVELGHDEDEVRQFLDGLGLPSRPNVEVPPELEDQFNEPEEESDLEERLRRMENNIVLLSAVAEKLTRIIEQQHGVSVQDDDKS